MIKAEHHDETLEGAIQSCVRLFILVSSLELVLACASISSANKMETVTEESW